MPWFSVLLVFVFSLYYQPYALNSIPFLHFWSENPENVCIFASQRLQRTKIKEHIMASFTREKQEKRHISSGNEVYTDWKEFFLSNQLIYASPSVTHRNLPNDYVKKDLIYVFTLNVSRSFVLIYFVSNKIHSLVVFDAHILVCCLYWSLSILSIDTYIFDVYTLQHRLICHIKFAVLLLCLFFYG